MDESAHNREERIPVQRHRIAFLYNRCELEHFGVHVQRRNRSRRDYNTAESLKNGANRKCRVKTAILFRSVSDPEQQTMTAIAHTKWKMGLGIVALSVSNGSRISRNPTG
jgi:hypothetical protein